MKKILFVFVLVLLAVGGYIFYTKYYNVGIPKLVVEDEPIVIDNIFIYGTHLNFHGNLVDDKNLTIVLYNGEFNEYNINIENNYFNLSPYVNEGIYLDNIPVGEYYLFLRASDKDENGNDIYRYYSLNNNTKYSEMTYYTLMKTNNKILITTDSEYNTLKLSVSTNSDKEIYDVVIDPGHGGLDSGATKNGYREDEINMKIALNLKEKLESYGYSVKLTHEDGQLSELEKLNDYNAHGRAVISSEVKAKYLFSIHMNSNYYSYVHGIEIYTPADINYDFIKNMAINISKNADVDYSNNKINKMYDGIYTRNFTEENIASSKEEYLKKNMIPYDITTKSNYYFMIRETGGIVTGAYVDDRNSDIQENPYFDSNVATEAYLLELGYLSNDNDFNNIINNMDKYTEAIASTFNQYINS